MTCKLFRYGMQSKLSTFIVFYNGFDVENMDSCHFIVVICKLVTRRSDESASFLPATKVRVFYHRVICKLVTRRGDESASFLPPKKYKRCVPSSDIACRVNISSSRMAISTLVNLSIRFLLLALQTC